MRILLVEDDELTAQALIAILTHQNHVVESAVNSQTAWDLIRTFSYDLMLLSVTIPDLDGVSLCRKIRNRGLQTPILLMTNQASSHEKAIGLDAGADDYVIKPFDPEELVARVRALLRRGMISSQPVLQWGLLRLDPTSCNVTYDDQPLSLTPKEYALLELFLRNTRRVFSCGVILEHLWAYEEMPGEEAVRTHIKGLRQKLKAVGAPVDWIETVYGIGYRLKPLEENTATSTRTVELSDQSIERPVGNCSQLFDELTHRSSESSHLAIATGWAPAIELQETNTDIILKAEIPGIAVQDLDVLVGETSVSIAREDREETKTEQKGYFHTELHYGSFHRVVPLPVAVQNHQVSADFKDGFLTLTMPKVETTRQNMVKVDLQAEARERTASQQQHEEELQDKVHTRANQEVSSPGVA
jgi:DNA-binding response OmpR family regulator/HSP20 family molecular chaperone IbpA